ncbi:hypothetical protein GGS24DRAFT_511432 [Hypoxylon argillaceum]|nr:hypothetical protein GGS24DRAFT_511432 [Hypoxylon argillaceum]
MAIVPRARDPNAPLVPPPAGVVPNFVNPPNGNALMNGVVSLSLSLTVVFVIFYTYGKTTHKLHVDDYLAIIALGAFIVCHIFIYRITGSTGYFVHGWNLQVKDQAWHFFNIFITTTMYNVAEIFIKAAILLQWARLFAPGERNLFFWLCYSVAVINAIFYLATILIDLLRCHPVQYHWDKTIPGGHCDNDDLLSPLSAVINLVIDITILFIPQRVIWKLNLNSKMKLGISVVFVAGILCIVFASVRLSWAIKLLNAKDYAYDASFEVLYGSLEMTFAFLTFSLPGIPKPFTMLVHQTKSSLERVVQSSWGSKAGLSRLFTNRSSSEAITYYADADERRLMPMAKASSAKSASSEKQNLPMPMKDVSQEAQDQAILRTTTYNVSEGYVPDGNIDVRGVLPQHNSWVPVSTKPEAH